MEKQYLLPLPVQPLLCCREVFVSSNSFSQVTFETNRYSVPCRYESKKNLLLKAFVTHIEIYDQDTLLAKHDRCYEKQKEIFNFDHYLDLLAIRPGAVPYARPLIYANLAPIYREFEKRLIVTSHGSKDYIEILKLLRNHKKELVEASLHEAAKKGMYNLETVKQILYRMSEEVPKLVPFNETDHSYLPSVRVQPPDMNQFNRLLSGKKVMIQ